MEEKTKEISLNYDILSQFNDELATDFLSWCLDVEQFNDAFLEEHNDIDSLPFLLINICSEGGAVDSLFKMLSAISILPNKIVVRGFGNVASCALFFYLAAGDIRLATPLTEFVYHNVSYSLGQNTLEDHRKFLKETDKLQAKIDTMISENSNITLKQLKSHKYDDWVIDFEEACELGVVTFDGQLRDLYVDKNAEEEEDGK